MKNGQKVPICTVLGPSGHPLEICHAVFLYTCVFRGGTVLHSSPSPAPRSADSAGSVASLSLADVDAAFDHLSRSDWIPTSLHLPPRPTPYLTHCSSHMGAAHSRAGSAVHCRIHVSQWKPSEHVRPFFFG